MLKNVEKRIKFLVMKEENYEQFKKRMVSTRAV